MITKEFFHYLNRTINSIYWALLLPGIILIALGIFIYLFPEWLAVLAGFFFVWIGLIFVLLALKIFAAKRKYHKYWKMME